MGLDHLTMNDIERMCIRSAQRVARRHNDAALARIRRERARTFVAGSVICVTGAIVVLVCLIALAAHGVDMR